MNINLNNKTYETQAATLQQLADELALPEKGVAVAIDNVMVPHHEWAEREINSNQNILIIKAFAGG